ncbi:MAG: ATP phosphoribosyltransferase regulatory subunit [Clostridia bacterium]|nr:ATP phosphoribosyltransferase regulatory subunit [Clostridia bacterium]
MNINNKILKNEERAIFELRELYQKYGYSQFKMSKFEEYDLYVRNKNFLVSDNIITFTDTNGKLMALKPDVTLSIIKNSKENDKGVKKVYYNENVYRISNGTKSYKEIMQVGLECIGDIDTYNIFEVLKLAADSLNIISDEFVLDISHLGIISYVIERMSVSAEDESELIKCISEKNIDGIVKICKEKGYSSDILEKLVQTYGTPSEVLKTLKELDLDMCCEYISELSEIVTYLENIGYGGKIKIDFSVINDMHYYNGFVFKGFINGISTGVLSGGQYDKLMSKMDKNSKAIGFAVYLDLLERFEKSDKRFDVDIVLLYDENAELSALNDAISMLTSNGKSVMAQKCMPDKIKYKQLLKLQERGVEIIENNA